MVAIWGEALRHDCINAELKVRRKESYDINWSTSETRRKILRPAYRVRGSEQHLLRRSSETFLLLI
jgi:hypothetical protein